MKLKRSLIVCSVCILLLSHSIFGQIIPERQWPGYRGYFASGVLDNANLPETFDFGKMENVRWKIRVPGMGISSPVI